jgi:uncharacterized membrane protein YsdA (DUF1294 family)
VGRRYYHHPGSFIVLYPFSYIIACVCWGVSNAPWYVSGYLTCINVAALVTFCVDKGRAVRGEWRIPEARLHLLTLAGGVLGSGAGMLFARHKIRNLSFHAMYFVGIVTFCAIATILAPSAKAGTATQASNPAASSSAKAHKAHPHTRHHPTQYAS